MLWIVLKPLLFAVCFVFGCASLLAQKPGWQPSPGHTQVPIWPRTPPDAQFGPPPNTETMPEPGEIDNVSRPTMTVYPRPSEPHGTKCTARATQQIVTNSDIFR